MRQLIADIGASLPWLVCVEDGQIFGYAYATKWLARAAYQHMVESSVYLCGATAGKGFGNTLYRTLIAEFQKLQVHTVIGGIVFPNLASIALSKKIWLETAARFVQVGEKLDRWIYLGYWQRVL
jgi:L-amino acid N-acyltransferase YncA